MDRFDRIAIGVFIALVVGMAVLIVGHRGAGVPDGKLQQRSVAAPAAPSAELEAGVKLVRNLIEGGSLDRAEALIRDLQQKFPYQGELSLLMGDVFMRKQEPIKAMYQYKEAIDLNPDYLDKKTPLFQGKKMKVAVGEAQADIDRKLRERPGDASLKDEKKMIYYLYRKIAGSCG